MKKDIALRLGKKLQKLSRKATIGQGEGTQAIGGSTVGPEQESTILSPNFATGSVYDSCNRIELRLDNVNSGRVPFISQSSYGQAGILGGVLAYWGDEGADVTHSEAAFDGAMLGLNKLSVIVPVTSELLDDAEGLAEHVSKYMSLGCRIKLDNAILYGSGSKKLKGVLGSGDDATKFVSCDFSLAQLIDMVQSYYGGKDGQWVMSQGALNAILDKYEADSVSWTSAFNMADKVLLGYKYSVSASMGGIDIVLGDFSQYAVIEKPPREEVDSGLLFLSDQLMFKAVLRVNGQPTWTGPITLDDGKVVYPFVANATSEVSSTSSASSISSSLSSASSASSVSSMTQSSVSSASSGSSDSSASTLSTQSSRSSASSVSSASSASTPSSVSSVSSASSVSSVSSGSSSSTANKEFAVTGTNSPNVDGLYYLVGTYNSAEAYERANGTMWLWYDNFSSSYVLSAAKGVKGAWFLNGVGAVPAGSYTAQGAATGTATVT